MEKVVVVVELAEDSLHFAVLAVAWVGAGLNQKFLALWLG